MHHSAHQLGLRGLVAARPADSACCAMKPRKNVFTCRSKLLLGFPRTRLCFGFVAKSNSVEDPRAKQLCQESPRLYENKGCQYHAQISEELLSGWSPLRGRHFFDPSLGDMAQLTVEDSRFIQRYLPNKAITTCIQWIQYPKKCYCIYFVSTHPAAGMVCN